MCAAWPLVWVAVQMGDYSRFYDSECVYVHPSSCLAVLFCLTAAGP